MARPTKYSRTLADAITADLAAGKSLRAICSAEGMPNRSTVRGWVIDNIDGFSDRYASARDVGLDELADELLHVADTPMTGRKTVQKATGTEITEGDMVEHRRLQVDARKWYLSKLAPKKYGERQAIDMTSSDGTMALDVTARAARIAQILAAAAARKRLAETDPNGDLL